MSPYPASLDRRQFLALAGAMPLVFAASSLSVSPARGAPATPRRVGPARLKPALNAYSFADLLNAHLKDARQGVDLFQLCDFCAREGFDAIDPTGYFFPTYPRVPADEYVYALKRRAFDLGLAISGTGVRNDFATADAAVRAEGVRLAQAWIEVAAKLGAPVIRVFAGPQAPHKTWQAAAGSAPREQVEGWMAEEIRACAEHGAKFGVIVGVQNHGDFISTAAEHLHLVERVNHPWCGPIVDTGKYLTPDPYADIAQAAPYAVNWQVKETPFGTPDKPRTDLKRLVQIIRQSGYQGYVPIETLTMGRKDYDPYREAARLNQELRAAIAATA